MKKYFYLRIIMAAMLILVFLSMISIAQEQGDSPPISLPNDAHPAVPVPDPTEKRTYFKDADGDGYGDGNNTIESTYPPPKGYIRSCIDCNDKEASIHPGAIEICGDGIDQDCDGADLLCPLNIEGT